MNAPFRISAADPRDTQAQAAAPAPVPGATLYDPPVGETFMPADEASWTSRRHDGWSAANQRIFLEALAEGFGVESACYRVGLSAASAYAFRRTAKCAAFALGWRAATLVARDAVAETLLVRALQGQVDTLTRADGSVVTRHRHDNRLAMSLLARLDRQVEAAPDPDVRAARLVAQEFDAFLDLVGKDAGAARAGAALCARRRRPAGPHRRRHRGGGRHRRSRSRPSPYMDGRAMGARRGRRSGVARRPGPAGGRASGNRASVSTFSTFAG